jgi:hypothetical protein
MAAQIPMMHTEDGICRIKKREYIGDVTMTNLFTNRIYILSPIDSGTFPWLSKIAGNFEQYKFLGLTFGFRSLTANALGVSGLPGMGSVTMLTQYDVYDAAVGDKTEANNALFATSSKPSENMLHPVECDPNQTPNQPLYTGINEVSIPDLRLNALGYTTVSTVGSSGLNYICGELWVTYDIMLYKPMISTVPALNSSAVQKPISVSERYRLQTKEDQKDAAELFIDIPPPTPTTARRF